MKTFKSFHDLDQLGDGPLRSVIKTLLTPLVNDPSYSPEIDGYIVLVEPDDVDRVLDDLDLPWRLSEVPFEGVTLIHGHYHAVYLPNNQFALSFLIHDAEWLPDDLRRHLEAHL